MNEYTSRDICVKHNKKITRLSCQFQLHKITTRSRRNVLKLIANAVRVEPLN